MSAPFTSLVIALPIFAAHAAATPIIQEIAPAPGSGLFTLVDSSGGTSGGASGLSGLTYDPVNGLFYAVSDNDSLVYPIRLEFDLNTGRITAGDIAEPITLRDAADEPLAFRDQEDLAFNDTNRSVFVCCEFGPVITEHALSGGKQLSELVMPPAYAHIRKNKALEAIARNAAGQMWTANEEALECDGPTSSPGLGTTVRLTRYDCSDTPAAQFLYQTDGSDGSFVTAVSGVGAMLLLDNGSLIVMERAGGTGLRNRLYLVDADTASDVLAVETLTGNEAPVSKMLLWTGYFPPQTNDAVNNFEGLALGPALTDGSGDRVLVLVADNDKSENATHHNFYALRLSVMTHVKP
ncbi:MAG: esterase-like activity of phytase family protein [Phycisphaeraceae bacterium]|nr:esterase-like activity of phytase family protein [Phycisphaeraceae bacterium]